MAADGPSNATVVRIVVVVLGVLILAYALYLVRQILVLVIVALFLAIGLDPIVRWVQRFRLPRGGAVAVVLVGLLLFIGGFFASVTPPLVRQTVRLAEQIPTFSRELSGRSQRFRELDRQFDISKRVRETVSDIPSVAGASAGKALGIARSVGRTVFSVLTVLVLTIYFLLDLPNLIAGAAKLVAKTRRKQMQEHADVVFRSISSYIIGNIAISIVAGVVSYIALSLLRVPYALPLAMWVAVADLIPMVGATLGAIPAVIVAFFHSLPTGIGTLVFYAIYQQVENYVVSPRVLRQAVNISAAAVLLAALVGATLLGFVGALLAIPIAASIKIIGQEVLLPRQESA